MNEDWKEIDREVPVELLASIGRFALSFATLENAIELLLVRGGGTTKPQHELSSAGLSVKLRCLRRFLNSKKLSDLASCVQRMTELAKIRNDLMHGFLWCMIWPQPGYVAWNPGRRRNQEISVERLDDISREVIAYALTLEERIT